MAAVRESLFPAIKCSMCNADVEISQLGDHICAVEREESKYKIFQFSKKKTSAKGTQAQKLANLPRIDSAAANRPFHRQEQFTSSSSTTGSEGRSPPTPRDGQPLQTPIHNSPLSPHPQSRKSSYNLDSPYPPFKSPKISPMSPYGLPTKSNEFYSSQGSLSPVATGGRDVASRMNNITPGPFGVNHNNSSKDRIHEVIPFASAEENVEPPLANHPDDGDGRGGRRNQVGRSSSGYVATHREGGDRAGEWEQEVPRRAPTPSSDYSSGRRTSQSPESQSRQPPRGRNVPPPTAFGQRGGKIRTEAPKQLHTHQSRRSDTISNNPKIEGLRPEARSKTFPLVNHGPPNGKLRPHPGVGLPRSPSATVRHTKNKSSTTLSGFLLAPSVGAPDVLMTDTRILESRRQPSMEDMLKVFPLPKQGISPPVGARPLPRTLSPPNPGDYSDFSVGNPYEAETQVEDPHIASPSISSNASSIFSHRSERSSASATSSPPTPNVPGSKLPLERWPSESTNKKNSGECNDHIDGLMKELQSSIHDLVATPVQDKEDSLSIPRKHAGGPSYGYSTPAPLKLTPQIPTPLQRQPPPPGVYQQPPSPRTVPPTPGFRPLQYAGKLPVPQRKQSVPLGSPVEELFLPLQPQSQQHQERTTRRPTTKGNCRGCEVAIVGKSISSADGRLTGRYHKACFVCQDCRKPFESAEFYVHNNLPYCERHYHKLNQSLCPTCDRGIEGPCLETEWHERYHPSCFSCSECACSLDGDYFEFNKRPFCEQHAYTMIQGSQLAPNRMANMERRKTRMMFM